MTKTKCTRCRKESVIIKTQPIMSVGVILLHIAISLLTCGWWVFGFTIHLIYRLCVNREKMFCYTCQSWLS